MSDLKAETDHRVYERLDLIAFFGATCLFFSTIEYLFPKPFPFFRLGLANLPVIISLKLFTPRYVLLLVLLKVLGQGLINGTLASYVFLFSLGGSFSSAFVMLASQRLFGDRISLVGISVFGAIASNVVQIFLSVRFIFGLSAWIIAPPFVALGVASGFAVGLFAQKFQQSRWLEKVRESLQK